jgi:hypothetical protein
MDARRAGRTVGRRGLTPKQRRDGHDALKDKLADGVAALATG